MEIKNIPDAMRFFKAGNSPVICEKINGEQKTCNNLAEAAEFLRDPTDKQECILPTGDVTVLNVDELKPNSVLVIKLDVKSPEEKMAVLPSFAKLINPYAQSLRDKRVTVMIMSKSESIESIPEAEMNKAGWFKKEKSLIINPYEKS
jgi:hypothetical protein